MNYRNCLNKVKRTAKSQYYANYFSENYGNMKKSWSMLNKILGRISDKSYIPNYIEENGIRISDVQSMSNKFNDYFGGIGKKFNLGVEKARNSALSYLKGDIQCKMELELVSEQCIAQTINSLKNKSSYGNDGLTL